MEVRLLEATEDPEELICTGARNDYSEPFVGDQTFEETMETVEGDSLEEKKETLIGHLPSHGHYGPFEHPQVTFAVEGVSRSCMAQITRHRHVSFDVQSMRYVSFNDVDPADVREGEMVVVLPSATDLEWVGRNQRTGQVDEETVAKRDEIFRDTVADAVESYQELLDLGMPPRTPGSSSPSGRRSTWSCR